MLNEKKREWIEKECKAALCDAENVQFVGDECGFNLFKSRILRVKTALSALGDGDEEILIKLLTGELVSPLYADDEWTQAEGCSFYYAERYPNLISFGIPGTKNTAYSDLSRIKWVCSNETVKYECPEELAYFTDIIDQIYPIDLPYLPMEKLHVYFDQFSSTGGDTPDTVILQYVRAIAELNGKVKTKTDKIWKSYAIEGEKVREIDNKTFLNRYMAANSRNRISK